ncbi:Sat13 [Stachybotrys chartarum IBT 7711]|uniref:Highly reducing polyketide synthase SAT13 n=1 Tax=Stachybotrys chartarum (strain CBS 109288 / IBT 7711) TaxID=1280523 RepID=SAT13_STACB|nr:RecName: Full=Highly reducing polyketide synthase SAT13; AltName: Full=Satratoxin biosynthesis SC2 cluster protein 13 [Stachybotrys chartarum IBT 7711]KEY67212.1 Sat13 [Stachybotrys chartarum IBT 7711]
MSGPNPVPLAIVGIACRFPGDATNPERFWDLLANARSGWSRVPNDRWNEEAFWHPDPDDTNGTNNHMGGHFLNQDLARFDAGFFNVTPQEAASMDPQQRLLLETTYEALESAGIPQEHIRGSNTAAYMAMFTRDYDRNVYKDMMSIPKYHVTGTGDAILANRISHLFDLRGPSVTMDTGCSGGLTAISHACQALRSGLSDIGLAGAVNLILTPDHMVGMSNLHMLNVNGRSFSFDSRGAGYGRGEGVATLVIKRLDDAIRDKDPVRAILRDAAINQDGYTAGITLPSGRAQQALERRVWDVLNLDPATVGYVEAHGTGTLAGDSAELEGISKIFCENRDHGSPLIVGSVKSNIGHTECVSGIAAVIKSTLILENGTIPPNINFEQPRESLDLRNKKIKVPNALMPWPQTTGTARISVNSFGYGGTNAHAVLERAERVIDTTCPQEDDAPQLFIFSAASQTSLLGMLAANRDWVSENRERAWVMRDLAYTLSQRRSLLPWRFSCVAANRSELLETLSSVPQNANSIARITPGSRISFIFTGQGAQWAGMGRELLSMPTFNSSLQRSNEILQDLGCSWDLIEEVSKQKPESRLHEPELSQPLTTAIQIALVDLFREWGIVPDSVIGHSSGEIGAAYTAGHIAHCQAIKVAYFRGFSSAWAAQAHKRGAMLAVGLGEYDVEPYLEQLGQGHASIACQNSPNSTTVSGDDAAISELSEILTKESIFNRKLNITVAYHSHHMQTAACQYKAALEPLLTNPSLDTGIEMFSTVTGSIKKDAFNSNYWVENLVSKVRFCDGLQALCESTQASPLGSSKAERIFIEIGPHSALAGPTRQCIADLITPLPYSYTSGLLRETGAVKSALAMVGHIFNRGYSLNLAAISASNKTSQYATVLSNLPSYHWDHTRRHWNESRISREYRFRKHPYHDLLGLRMTEVSPLRPSWRHMIGTKGLPWLADHVVDDLVIFPGSGYLAMAIEACSQLADDRYPGREIERFSLNDIFFLKGLIIPDDGARVEVQLSLNPIEPADKDTRMNVMQHEFSVTAFTDEARWNEHCRGNIVVVFKTSSATERLVANGFTRGDMAAQLDPVSGKLTHAGQLYPELRKAGNSYGLTFNGIQRMKIGADSASSDVIIPDVVSRMPACHMRPHIIHPTTLDILLHTTLPLVHQKLGVGSVMPVHIRNMDVSADIESTPRKMFRVVTTLTSSHARAADTELFVFSEEGHVDDTPVVSAAGMELRSFVARDSNDAGSSDGHRDICSELKWIPDERFITAKHLQVLQPSILTKDALARCYALMAQYLKQMAIKHSDLSVLELGGDDTTSGATKTFLEVFHAGGTAPAMYDFCTSLKDFDVIQRKLEAFDCEKVHKMEMKRIELDAVSENRYDVVLSCNTIYNAADVKSVLSHARKLLKLDGVLLFVEDMSSRESRSSSEWSKLMSEASFKMQLAVTDNDATRQLTFFATRAVEDAIASVHNVSIVSGCNLPLHIQNFLPQIESELGSKGMQVTRSRWDKLPPNGTDIYIIVDDGSRPILSGINQDRFRIVTGLLQKTARIIWLSVQDDETFRFNPRKHLITGLSRTAHAENEGLDMVTIDVQETLNQKTQPEVIGFLSQVVGLFDCKHITREREYVYNGTDILIPRLIPHQRLNLQVSGKIGTSIEAMAFTNSSVPLKLSDGQNRLVFVENMDHKQALCHDYVEIETKAVGLPPGFNGVQSGNTVYEYAGIIIAVGSEVSTLKAGDRAVAYSSTPCANVLRVPAIQAQLIPSNLSFKDAAAMPRALMAVSHALVHIANVQPGQVVFVDDAATEIGLAAICVAQNLGSTLIAAVSTKEEAAFIKNTFKVPSRHIVPRDSYFGQRQVRTLVRPNGGLDVILGCGKSPVTAVTSELLKPFGLLVHVRNRASDPKRYDGTGYPPNLTVASFDIDSLLQASTKNSAELFQKVMEMVNRGMIPPSQSIVAIEAGIKIEEAISLAQKQGSMKKCVLEFNENSIVNVETSFHHIPSLKPHATYVVAGGLGDLGQRLLRLMAQAGARHLVSLSRKGAGSKEFRGLEKELKGVHPGCSLLAIDCDILREESVSAALAEIKQQGFPTVKGVVQSAVILKDATLDSMTAELFNSVVSVKAEGTLNLHRVFIQEELAFFISFSSVMSIIGGKAQANYNAGNAVQDAFAQFERRNPHCFYMSLNIGGIKDAAVNNDAIVQSIRRQGLTQISHEELSSYLKYAFSDDARKTGCKQPVIGFTAETIVSTTAVNGTAHTPMFTHVRQKPTAKTTVGNVNEKRSFKDIVNSGTNKGEISEFVARSICDKIADLTGIDLAEVNLDSGISDYGLDSLVSIELRNWLMREFDSPIQSSEVLDSHGIRDLAQKVVSRSRLVTTETDVVHTVNGEAPT